MAAYGSPTRIRRLILAAKAFAMRWSAPWGSSWPFWSMGLLPGTRRHWETDAGDLSRNSAVFAGIAWIQRNFPDARLQVVTESGEKPTAIPRHPLTELLKRPNPHYSSTALWAGSLISYLADGNAYWMKARNTIAGGPGLPVELWWVPHWMMRPERPRNGGAFLEKYVYTVNGKEYDVKPADVVHLRYGRDPYNDLLGLSPWKACLREIVADNEALTYHAAIMQNFGVPGVVASPATPDVTPTEPMARQFRDLWKQKMTGDHRGEPLVVPWPVKLEMPGWSPEQLMLEKVFHLSEERICAVLGLSPMVLGLGSGLERSTFSNYSEAREAAYYDCLIPIQRMIAEELNAQLLPDLGDPEAQCVCWDYSDVRALQPDMGEVAKRNVLLFNAGLIRQSEARTDQGLPVTPEMEKFAYEIAGLVAAKRPQTQPGATGNGSSGDKALLAAKWRERRLAAERGEN